jgi:hypothetical protein
MRKKTLVRLFTIASLALVGLAGPATAANADVVTSASIASSSGYGLQSLTPMSRFVYHHTFDTKQQCNEEGERMYEWGSIRDWSCVYRRGAYELWVKWFE